MTNRFQSDSLMATPLKFFLLALLTISIATSRSVAVAQANSATSVEKETAKDEIEKLILQLGSSSYSVRQLATERLWLFGNDAKPALEKASQAGNSEVAKRANDILGVLEMGVDFRTKPGIAKMVLDFQTSETEGRLAIVRRLVKQEKLKLTFDLLERVKDIPAQFQLYSESIDIQSLLGKLAIEDRWEEFEMIVAHPITFEHYRSAGVLFHKLNGTLDSVIEPLKNAIKEKEKAGKKIESIELMKLIAICKFKGDFELAEFYANKIKEPDQRFAVLNLMILEQGDWKRIAEKMVSVDEVVKPEDGKIVVSPAQRAVVYRFLGDNRRYDETIDKLKTKLVGLEKDKNESAAKNLRARLTEIGAACQDWELVEPNIDESEKYRAFQTYMALNRNKKAFEMIGLGDTVEQRSVWFKRSLRKINSLSKKITRLREQHADLRETTAELQELWTISFQVCSVLGGLGLTDEAVLHYQTLYAANGDSQIEESWRFRIVAGLIQLERYDEAWKLIGETITRKELRELDNQLFPNKISSAYYWLSNLQDRYPNAVTRLKVVAGILNSPIGTTPDFNLELELASMRSKPSLNSRGRVDYEFSQVYKYHGDEEASRLHLQMAEELGDRSAKRVAALAATVGDDPKVVIDYYEKIWRDNVSRSSMSFAPVLAAEGFAAKGENKKATLRMCLAYVQWMTSYRNSGTISSFETLEKLNLIADFLKLDVYALAGDQVSNERNRFKMSESLLDADPAVNLIGRQMKMFNDLSTEFSGAKTIETWAEEGKQINILLAKQLVRQKNFDEAVQVVLRANEFSPGDPSLVEEVVPDLDAAGATAQADELFEAVTEFYFDLIQKYPDSSLHRNNYAWACACAKRRMEHMKRHSSLAVAERPNSPTYLDTLAEIHFLLGDSERAIELSKRCIELNPTRKYYQDQVKRFSKQQ